MCTNLVSALKQHVASKGTVGLLPQNLPDSILHELNEVFEMQPVEKCGTKNRGPYLAGPLYCVITLLHHQKKKDSLEIDIDTLKNAVEIYSTNLALEALARKNSFEINPKPSITNIFSLDRNVEIPRNYLEL